MPHPDQWALEYDRYYWCCCHIYLDPETDGYIGAYTITAGTEMIITLDPNAPLSMIDIQHPNARRCGRYIVRFVSKQDHALIGMMDYSVFLMMIAGERLEPYDECHAVLHDFTEDRIRDLLERKGTFVSR